MFYLCLLFLFPFLDVTWNSHWRVPSSCHASEAEYQILQQELHKEKQSAEERNGAERSKVQANCEALRIVESRGSQKWWHWRGPTSNRWCLDFSRPQGSPGHLAPELVLFCFSERVDASCISYWPLPVTPDMREEWGLGNFSTCSWCGKLIV